MINAALQFGTRDWSIGRYAVWMASADGIIRTVNPVYYYRVGPPEYDDLLTSHIIAEPYRHYGLDIRKEPQVYTNLPEFRIRIIKVIGDYATVQHFE